MDTYLPEPIRSIPFTGMPVIFRCLSRVIRPSGKRPATVEKISSRLLVESVRFSRDPRYTQVVIGDSMVDGNGGKDDFMAVGQIFGQVPCCRQYSGGECRAIGFPVAERRHRHRQPVAFQRDVLQQPGVSCCIVQVGLNDIGLAGTALDPDSPVPAATVLIKGYRQLLQRAREYHIRMTGVTLVPLRGAGEYGIERFYQPEKEVVRQAVNHWMRTSRDLMR
ncbi:hypothetical protein [Aeromonas sp. Marseille-Q7275]